MQNVISIIAWSTECLVVLVCIHGIFGKKLDINIWNLLLMLCNIILFLFILQGVLPRFFTFGMYIIIFLYCLGEFKRKFLETMVYFTLSIILSGFIEIAATYIIAPLEEVVNRQWVLVLCINSISLLLANALVCFFNKKRNHVYFQLSDKKLIFTLLLCGGILIFMILEYQYHGVLDRIHYFVLMGMIVLICIFIVKMQKVQQELEKKKIELNLQDEYGDTYQELLYEVRRKQHDFTNQLSAIYSMHLTATSLEDLVEKQRKYGDEIIENCRYDKLLVGCNNAILASYLYYKCLDFQQQGVMVDYTIHVDQAECRIDLHELIEILGIFMTNAFESYEEAVCGRKLIILLLQENNEGLLMEIRNLSPYMKCDEIEKLFQKGYSTKGENRGLGLTRVKQLAEKYEIDMMVENVSCGEENWICFKIRIPKE